MARFRMVIVIVAALVGIVLLSVFVFVSTAQPAYACSTIWSPFPTASPSAGATPNLGDVQPDMGHDHVNSGIVVTYPYCPPASGLHVNQAGSGPIRPRVYGPADNALPQGWIHNLEHGALVIVYTGSGEGATEAGQARLKAFYDAFPPSPVCGFAKGTIGPVIARFDQMATPYAAIVWDRVLPLDTFDEARILAFWNQWGERTNRESQCPAPSAGPPVRGAGEVQLARVVTSIETKSRQRGIASKHG